MNRQRNYGKLASRKAKELQKLQKKFKHSAEIMQLLHDCPKLDDFISSLDTSGIHRLIGIFCCTPEQYLCTEKILEERGFSGYRTLQCPIEGDRISGGDGKGRGWTSAVKLQNECDDQFKIFIGLVRPSPTGVSASDRILPWEALISVVHELGHANDLDKGITFRIGKTFNLEEAEYYAHKFSCRLFRVRKMIMGLTTYLSVAICPMTDKGPGSTANAARRFLTSEEYRQSFSMIPKHVRRQFKLTEPIYP
ncbi:MAG TPA: hypothetical protein VMW24_10780 [Sedimentisphaerales bacterium]|nr:hypothetical protein [Sedimentisphaerales bacterium]